MPEGVTLKLNNYMSRTIFEGILLSLCYTDKSMLNIMMGSSKYVKWNKHGKLTWLKNLIHHGLMYLKNCMEWFNKYVP